MDGHDREKSFFRHGVCGWCSEPGQIALLGVVCMHASPCVMKMEFWGLRTRGRILCPTLFSLCFAEANSHPPEEEYKKLFFFFHCLWEFYVSLILEVQLSNSSHTITDAAQRYPFWHPAYDHRLHGIDWNSSGVGLTCKLFDWTQPIVTCDGSEPKARDHDGFPELVLAEWSGQSNPRSWRTTTFATGPWYDVNRRVSDCSSSGGEGNKKTFFLLQPVSNNRTRWAKLHTWQLWISSL